MIPFGEPGGIEYTKGLVNDMFHWPSYNNAQVSGLGSFWGDLTDAAKDKAADGGYNIPPSLPDFPSGAPGDLTDSLGDMANQAAKTHANTMGDDFDKTIGKFLPWVIGGGIAITAVVGFAIYKIARG